MKGEDESEYAVDRAICCSVSTFLMSNYIWATLSLVLVAVGVVGVVINEGILVILPPQAYFALIAFGAFGLLVIFCGVFGQKQRVELCFLIYILLVALGLIAQTLAYSFLLLYANDVGTIKTLDDAAINAQNLFEKNLAEFAVEDAQRWIETQDQLDCCGIDFEAGLEDDGLDRDAINTGAVCSQDGGVLAGFEQDFRDDLGSGNDGCTDCDEFGNFIPARNDPNIGFDSEFFCKSKISAAIQKNTPVIGASLGVLVLIQIMALIAASRMYWVPEFLGGWQFDDEEMEVVAKRKGIPMPKNVDDFGGNRVLSNIRAQTSRLSYRFKNAYTPDPEIPKTQGFLNRLSMNRKFAPPGPLDDGGFHGIRGSNPRESADRVAFGQPNPAHNVSMGRTSNNRGMWQRLSNRFNFGKSGFIDMNAPPGLHSPKPPPGPPVPPASPFGQQPPNPPPQASWAREAGRRTSQRVQQGLKSLGGAVGSGFGFSKPAAPPGPPRQDSFNGNNNSVGFGRNPSGTNLNSFYNTSSNVPPLSPGFSSPPPMPPALHSQSMPKPNSGYGSTFASLPSMSSRSNSRGNLNSSRPDLNDSNGGMRGGFSSGRPTEMSRKPSQKPKKKRSKAPMAPRPAAKSKPAGPPAGGLLSQIQQGTRLKPTVTNDRSAPKV